MLRFKEQLKNISLKKTMIAIAVGWLTLLLSRYPLILDEIYHIYLPWYLIFPMLFCAGWGTLYMLMISIPGGAALFLPWLQQPEGGFGNLLKMILYLVLFYLCSRIGEDRRRIYTKYFMHHMCFLIYAVVYAICIVVIHSRLLYMNPHYHYSIFTSPVISMLTAITEGISVFGLSSTMILLLKLPFIRKLLGIEVLEYSEENSRSLFYVLAVVTAFFVTNMLFTTYYFAGRGAGMTTLIGKYGTLQQIPVYLVAISIISNVILTNRMRTTENQTKLAQSEMRYRLSFEHMSDYYFEIDQDGTILNCNNAASEIGLGEKAVTGNNLCNLFDDKNSIHHLIERLFQEQHIENEEIMVNLPGLGTRSLLASGSDLEIDGKRIATMILRDITEFKHTEAQRWELTAILNAIFESNEDFIWTVDAQDFLMGSYNQAFGEYAGIRLEKSSISGYRMENIFAPKDADFFNSCYEKVKTNGAVAAEHMIDSGEILDFNFYPVKLDGRIASIVVFSKNVTNQRKAEIKIRELNEGLEETVRNRTESLRLAYKDLESFSYTMTHELKTPIREIDTYLEIIEEDNQDTLKEESIRDIHSASRVCSSTLDMIEKMMIYAKAGFMNLSIEKIKVGELVTGYYNDIRKANPDKIIRLYIEDLPEIYADRFLLQVAISNVMSNSIKFARMREEIELRVSSEKREKEIIYCFRDNGVGFSMEESNRLFELFNRAHNSVDYEGNGIGLALVYRIIKRMGGNVEIRGEKDRGCSVYIHMVNNAE